MKRTLSKLLIISIVMVLFAAMPTTVSASGNGGSGVELFPTDVMEQHDDAGWRITRIYELGENENPANIPRESFTRNNWTFHLTDIVRRETTVTDTRNHVETFHIDTETDEISEILALLQPAIEFTSADGYTGVLELNRSSITTEVTETRNAPWTMTITREYPHLASNDTSLIPKTVRDRNMEYTLSNVQWKAGNTTTVDYIPIPDYYTATATYSRSGSSARPVAHVATVRYEGTIATHGPGKTIYTAHFLGEENRAAAPPAPSPTPIVPSEPSLPSPSPSPTNEPADTGLPASTPIDVNLGENSGGGGSFWWLIFIPIAGGLGYGGYVFWRKQRERAEDEED